MSHGVTAEQLRSYANWAALPEQVLRDATAAKQGGSHAGRQGDDLTTFLQHLAASVPQQWAVTQHDVFGRAAGEAGLVKAQRVQPAMHARAVGSASGLVAFGGMRAGQLAQVLVQHESSWTKSEGGLVQDFSRYHKAIPAQASSDVIRVAPRPSTAEQLQGSKAPPPWVAEPCSPALTAGLLGCSVALWGSRAYLFGGMRTSRDSDTGRTVQRPCDILQAYAVDAAGTQGGLLPVLSEPLPQFGPLPSRRTYHSAAVDAEGGVMYVYGGVAVREADGSRQPADTEAGLVHAFNLHTYTWSALHTKGAQRPRSTTLLAFFWHDGSLWAIPDRPAPQQQAGSSSSSSSRRGGSTAAAGGYQLFRLDVFTREWQLVPTQGGGPCHRSDACAVYRESNGELLVYGGRTADTPARMLSDVHLLQLQHTPPTWQWIQPKLLSTASKGGSSRGGSVQQQQQQGMLPLAGHVGGVIGSSGEVAFVGGYSRQDVREPQPLLQVLTRGVKPPTPEAAQLGGAADPQALALQHVRLQVARLVRQAAPKQVSLRPDGEGGVRLPAKLLSLYSALFDDLFQGLLDDEAESRPTGDDAAAPADQQQQQLQQHVQEVPVPGAPLDSVAGVCRWMMGLLTTAACSTTALVNMYRVADRLIVEQLMVEVLQELRQRVLSPHEAAAVMALAGDLQGVDRAVGASAEQQLRQHVQPATAPGIMALALAHNNQQLQAHCVEVMTAHRKNDVWAALDFALRFSQGPLQGACLGYLRFQSRGAGLLGATERILQAARRHVQPGQEPADVPVVRMLERDLLQEVDAASVSGLLPYIALCDKHTLPRLQDGLQAHMAKPATWQQLQAREHAQLREQLHQRYPVLMTCLVRRAQKVQQRSNA